MKKIIVIAALVLCTHFCFAQISSVSMIRYVNAMETACRKCVGAGGNNIINCENTFYTQMDSILNVSYLALKKKMSRGDFDILKMNQRVWLKERDNYFKQQESEIGKSGAGLEADKAQAIHQEALFVKDRVMYMLKR